MNLEQFQQLAQQGYNRIPVSREILADLDTPLSAYIKLADGPYSYLFESVHGGEQWGRYSIIGLPCQTVVKIKNDDICVEKDGNVIETAKTSNPLEWVEQFSSRFNVPEIAGLPRFNGGLVGYFGYETIGYIEPRLKSTGKEDPLDNPDILLMVSEEILVFDNLSGKLQIIIHANPEETDSWEQAQQRLNQLARRLREVQANSKSQSHSPRKVSDSDFISGFTQEGFEAAV